jgi:hypothetical protein
VEEWWTKLILDHGKTRKAMDSMIVRVSWEIWKEYNVRVFRHHRSSVIAIFTRIRDEARAWCLARANFLGNVIHVE